jgi:transcription elongation factor Elf1
MAGSACELQAKVGIEIFVVEILRYSMWIDECAAAACVFAISMNFSGT